MRFTVLTPTYNRAHLLERAYSSLCAQTFRDFEWLVVDDGSTDGTRELVSSWKPFFPIRYIWQSNGGMCSAINTGVAQAAGEFVAKLDSDDVCVPHALERFDYRWSQIPDPEKFACLVGLCYAEDGKSVIGKPYPADCADSFSLAEAIALINGAERWGIIRTDVWRKFPSPIFKGERVLGEGLVQYRILKKYAARFFNEPLRIYFQTPGSLCHSGDRRWSNPKGTAVYYKELALSRVPLKLRARSAIYAAQFSLVAAARELYLFASGKQESS